MQLEKQFNISLFRFEKGYTLFLGGVFVDLACSFTVFNKIFFKYVLVGMAIKEKRTPIVFTMGVRLGCSTL